MLGPAQPETGHEDASRNLRARCLKLRTRLSARLIHHFDRPGDLVLQSEIVLPFAAAIWIAARRETAIDADAR